LNFLRLYTDNRASFSISLIIRSLSSSSCSSSPAKWDTLLALQCASLRNLSIEFQLWYLVTLLLASQLLGHRIGLGLSWK
jgi:hypothetical protein